MPFFDKEIIFKNFSSAIYFFFKSDVGPDKKVVMINYWQVLKKFTERNFSFTFPLRDGVFYKGVIRTYLKAIVLFIRSFLGRLKSERGLKKFKAYQVVRCYYRCYKVLALIQYLSRFYTRWFNRPLYYFKGYQSFLRGTFFRVLTLFIMKIFILTNRIFNDDITRIKNHSDFFSL